jgi:hypothetical protein
MITTLGLSADAPGPVDTTYVLDMGRVLRRTFAVTTANLGTLWTAGVAVYSPALLLGLLAAILPLSTEGIQTLSKVAELADQLLSPALVGGTCFAAFESLQGRKAGLGHVLQFGFGAWGRLFVVSLFSGILLLLGFVLCILPLFFVMASVWLAPPVAVLEDERAGPAISRSHAMTEGNRTRTLGLTLAMLVPIVLAYVAMFGSVTVLFAIFHDGGGDLSPGVEAAVQLATSLVVIPLECLYVVASVVVYQELRINREGAGLDQLVRVFE